MSANGHRYNVSVVPGSMARRRVTSLTSVDNDANTRQNACDRSVKYWPRRIKIQEDLDPGSRSALAMSPPLFLPLKTSRLLRPLGELLQKSEIGLHILVI